MYYLLRILTLVVILQGSSIYPCVAKAQERIVPNGQATDGSNATLGISPTIRWHEVEPGFAITRVVVGVASYLISSELLVVKIQPTRFQLQLILAEDLNLPLLDVHEATKHVNGLVGINAHFFDPQGKSLGLLVRNGKVLHRLQQGGSVLTGIFSIHNSKATITHRSQFSYKPIPDLAIQAGPRLIENGKAVQLNAKEYATRRSGVALTSKGEIILFATFLRFPGATLTQIQQVLLLPELEITDALNLDGGGSSQLFITSNSAIADDTYITGGDKIPVALVVTHKK